MTFAGYNTPRGLAIDPAIFKLPGTHIMGSDGQSMPSGFSEVTYYQPSVGGPGGQVYELNINDGKIYKVDGWAMSNLDNVQGRLSILPYLGDMMVATGKCQRVLIVAINVGGSHSARWCPGGDLWPRIVRALDLLRDLGLKPTFWMRQIGQTDAQMGTTTADYIAQNQFSINVMRSLGMDAPFIMGRGAYQLYTPPANIAAIQAGQIAIGQSPGGMRLSGDDDTIPDGGEWRADGVHWKNWGRYHSVMGRWIPVITPAP
jgi:hypothetical protein